MEPSVELLASYWTIAGGALPHTDKDYSPFDFRDRVESAARAGFNGIGIWHTDLAHTLKKRSLRGMKQILDDNGMKYVELEFLTGWFSDGEEKKRSEILKRDLFTAAEQLRARHIKVGDFYQKKTPMPRLIESFADLCRQAADHGTRILFELMPFAMLDTLAGALEMITGAGAPNGGIILDLWHTAKLRIPFEDLTRIPSQYLLGVELNDGTFEAPWSLHEDTINHRRLCGEGEFDIRGFLGAVKKAGYNGPYGIEVLSEKLRCMPLEELTYRSYATTMAQFQS
jgi:sugar phosphate isomerase/epimerase